jgi:hypothetical protein
MLRMSLIKNTNVKKNIIVIEKNRRQYTFIELGSLCRQYLISNKFSLDQVNRRTQNKIESINTLVNSLDGYCATLQTSQIKVSALARIWA